MRARAVYRKPATRPARAFTLTELLLVLACVGILAVILLPALVRSRVPSKKLGCANNLKQVGLAARTWAIDNNGQFPMQVSVTNGGTMELVGSGLVFPHFQAMSNELSTPKILVCPNDEQRANATIFGSGLSDQNISYFLNVDAIPDNSTNLLCGDRNLTNPRSAGSRFVSISKGVHIGWTREIHSKQGYLCFADGRVEPAANSKPLTVIQLPAGVTNRLAIP
jgi:prepilin-type N-terminal cleavage/methylation domain-containing protein